jgi:hypothetical protein
VGINQSAGNGPRRSATTVVRRRIRAGELDIVQAALRNPVPDFRPLSLCKKGRANPYTGYFLGLLVTSENFPVNNCPSSGSIGKSLTSGGVSCLL